MEFKLFMMFWNHAGEVELYSIFVALPHNALLRQGIVAAGLESSQTHPAMSAWHSPAPVFVFFAFSLSCFLSSLHCLSSLSFFFHPASSLSVSQFSPSHPSLFVSYLGSNFHSPFLSLALSAGKGECRRSFSNWQYTDNCFLVTVTWQGLPG